jgi:hypothetical protein
MDWVSLIPPKRQIVAFYEGGLAKEDAQALLSKVFAVLKTDAAFFTDFWQGS